VNFGLEKQLDRIVETLALSALLANNPNGPYKNKIKDRLNQIAFPLEYITSLFEDQVFESVEE